MPREKNTLTPEEQRVVLEAYHRDLGTKEAQLRSAEARVQVLMSKADQNEKYRSMANEALSDMEEISGDLDEFRANPPDMRPDAEGTRAGLSDAFGNYAKNRDVANAGGIGVVGSNSTESGEQAEDPDEAGIEVDIGPAVSVGRGGRAETMSGQRLVVHPDDEQEEEGEDETVSPRTRRRRAAKQKTAAKGKRGKAKAEEE
jgi:hypothetical protein